MTSARFKAGHFFRKAALLLSTGFVICACDGEEPGGASAQGIPVFGEVTVLFEMIGAENSTGVPEKLGSLENTSWGRFHSLNESPSDVLLGVFYKADSSGLLILAVLPDSVELHGTRDHLIFRTGLNGAGVVTEPAMGTEFTAESLWTDPVAMQETLKNLIAFFKPDLVLVRMQSPEDIGLIAACWNTADATAGFFSLPDWNGYRGWGAFTGKGVERGVLQGMTPSDFQATVMMSAGLEWRHTGYPAMQAFTKSEI